ncbi:MAG: hypothetical protein ACI4RH_02875 [Huintestinicola sp.]
MSFIAGYVLGSGRAAGADTRVRKLDAAPSLWNFEISDGWEVRVKIASDVDNMQFFQFGTTHGGIVNYITEWSIYFCVYQNGKFRYASCSTNFYTRKQENYQNADVPNRLLFINENTDFAVTSGEMTVSAGGSDFLRLDVAGTFIGRHTPYSWNNDEERIKGETVISEEVFTHSKSDLGGSQYNGSYIVNGGADDFMQAVYGLYAVCRGLAVLQ